MTKPLSAKQRAFAQRTCCLPARSGKYLAPTGSDIADFIDLYNLDKRDIAYTLDLHWDDSERKTGCVSLRRWLSGKNTIEYARWRLLLAKYGAIAPCDI